MKENHCKKCIHLFVKETVDATTLIYGCKAGKEVITTIQDPFVPGITKTKYFVRPKEIKCNKRVVKEKKNEK